MNSISNACKGIRLICETADVVNTIERSVVANDHEEHPEVRNVYMASALTKLLSLAANCTEVGAQLYGATSATLRNIKAVEVVARCVQLPLSVAEEIEAGANREIELPNLIRNFLAPIASAIRVISEQQIYKEQAYLDMTPEKLATQSRRVYDDQGDIVGRRPVVREECERNLVAAREFESKANIAEAILKIGGSPRAITNLTAAYERLSRRLRGGFLVPPVPLHPLAAAAPAAPALGDMFNLLALPSIPRELEEDPIFSRYVCSITQEAIRHPVSLPGEPHLFEQSALVRWVRERRTSPTNRQVVALHDIVPKPAIQALIDHRLRFHQERLILHAQQAFALPADPALVAAAAAEE